MVDDFEAIQNPASIVVLLGTWEGDAELKADVDDEDGILR